MTETIEEKQEDFKTWSRKDRRNGEYQKMLGIKSKKKSILQEIQECQ